jgi:hypothetical protein
MKVYYTQELHKKMEYGYDYYTFRNITDNIYTWLTEQEIKIYRYGKVDSYFYITPEQYLIFKLKFL